MGAAEIAPRFACDAMMGGVARWLWAAGYEAAWTPDIDDDALVRMAWRDRRIILTTDSGIANRDVVRRGVVRALLLPTGLKRHEQVRHVFAAFRLRPGASRCMRCGGQLAAVDKTSVHGEAPARSYQWCERFWRCQNCARLYWDGTHWRRIRATLLALSAYGAAAAPD